ncbi:enoyl-CoA hydratase/isomerase family protein [Thiotrichales bacterium 19S3-7]|nr:enoyl-CoA hydratase/isomerase family protein [Thiotrichales bacterium 19S3-7]MCF6802878.1 enoyl-CoA hydratase/isomerase family protein [Thiotrichales bacterium 19S3-11]
MPVVLVSDNGCYRLQLNRCDKNNALSPDMLEGIYQHLVTVQSDSKARVLIIESNCEHFMVGGDIYYFAQLVSQPAQARRQIIQPMLDQAQMVIEIIATLDIPVIAVARGIVAGYGLSLVLACDYVIALEDSHFYSAYIDIGLTADGGQLWTLKEAVGLKRAKNMLLFNEKLLATDAKKLGLVDCLCQSDEQLDEKLTRLIKKLLQLPCNGFALLKKHLNAIEQLQETLITEKALFLTQIASDEFSCRINAFIERKSNQK